MLLLLLLLAQVSPVPAAAAHPVVASLMAGIRFCRLSRTLTPSNMHVAAAADNVDPVPTAAAAHPVVASLMAGISFLSSFQGIWVISPAPSPLSSSAEHAPRCSMQPSARSACRTMDSIAI
jgi:hypothetical protein